MKLKIIFVIFAYAIHMGEEMEENFGRKSLRERPLGGLDVYGGMVVTVIVKNEGVDWIHVARD
jgi:hypothetical protein